MDLTTLLHARTQVDLTTLLHARTQVDLTTLLHARTQVDLTTLLHARTQVDLTTLLHWLVDVARDPLSRQRRRQLRDGGGLGPEAAALLRFKEADQARSNLHRWAATACTIVATDARARACACVVCMQVHECLGL